MDVPAIWINTTELPPIGARVQIDSNAFHGPQAAGYVIRTTKTTFTIRLVQLTKHILRTSPVDVDFTVNIDWNTFTGDTLIARKNTKNTICWKTNVLDRAYPYNHEDINHIYVQYS